MNRHIAIGAMIICIGLGTPALADPEALTSTASLHCIHSSKEIDPEKRAELNSILDAGRGTYAEETVTAAMLESAALEIAKASDTELSCQNALKAGHALFVDALRHAEDGLRQKKHKLSRKPEIKSVQTAVIELWVADQAARFAYVSLKTDDKAGAPYWAQRLATANAREADGNSRKFMQDLLEDWTWIDRERFGNPVADHAWILVQHADADPSFQQMVLQRMEPLLEKGHLRPKHYAYLWDRVAVNTGRKQRYGTQPDWNCVNGKMQLKPLEDPANVNKRRKEMGLNPVEEGLAAMERGVCR